MSSGFMSAASTLLRRAGSLDEDDEVKFVEMFFDRDGGQVGIKPVGHKGLNEKDVKARPGVRAITGSRSKSVSVRGFQEEFGIEDRTVFELEPEIHQNPGLPEGSRQFIMFVSPELTSGE